MTQALITTLKCECTSHPSCGWEGTPSLIGFTNPSRLGAYCPKCTHWIKWVPQTSSWLLAFEDQTAANKPKAIPITVSPEATYEALIAVAEECWQTAEDHGWHITPRSTLERAMLVVTELSELCEAARASKLDTPSDHIPLFTYAEEEWADVLVRVFDHCVEDGVTHPRLIAALFAKMAYNQSRPYRHGNKTA